MQEDCQMQSLITNFMTKFHMPGNYDSQFSVTMPGKGGLLTDKIPAWEKYNYCKISKCEPSRRIKPLPQRKIANFPVSYRIILYSIFLARDSDRRIPPHSAWSLTVLAGLRAYRIEGRSFSLPAPSLLLLPLHYLVKMSELMYSPSLQKLFALSRMRSFKSACYLIGQSSKKAHTMWRLFSLK